MIEQKISKLNGYFDKEISLCVPLAADLLGTISLSLAVSAEPEPLFIFIWFAIIIAIVKIFIIGI